MSSPLAPISASRLMPISWLARNPGMLAEIVDGVSFGITQVPWSASSPYSLKYQSNVPELTV